MAALGMDVSGRIQWLPSNGENKEERGRKKGASGARKIIRLADVAPLLVRESLLVPG